MSHANLQPLFLTDQNTRCLIEHMLYRNKVRMQVAWLSVSTNKKNSRSLLSVVNAVQELHGRTSALCIFQLLDRCYITGRSTTFVFLILLWFLSHFALVLGVSRPMFGRWNAVTPISHITGDTWIWQMTFLWHGQRGCVDSAQLK